MIKAAEERKQNYDKKTCMRIQFILELYVHRQK